jgi:hypothetical protein
MRGATRSWSVLGASLTLLGCAETDAVVEAPAPFAAVAAATQPPKQDPPRPYRPGEAPVAALGDEPDEVVDVSLERGILNQGQVNDVLAQHAPRLSACYDHAGDAQLFAHGEVRLRFQLEDSGEVREVLVIDNELGNYPVERCLVVEGRKIRFPRPGGGKGSDFEYSMEFRSPRQKYVVVWRRGTLRRPIAARLRALGRCGSPGEQPVQAVAYIKPNGWVASVGLASEGRLEAGPARCVVNRIMRWHLRGDRGHVVRTSFRVNKDVNKGLRNTRPQEAAASLPRIQSPLGPTARLKRSARRVRPD